MNLILDKKLGINYSNKTQQIRFISENWVVKKIPKGKVLSLFV